MRVVVSALILVILVALPLPAQGNAPALQQTLSEKEKAEKAQVVLRELAQFEYKAKVEIPEVDCVFVEDGKLVGPTYRAQLKENPRAVKAGEITKPSQVKFMDRGIQVYFASDNCAVIGVTSAPIDTAKMSIKELVDLAKKSIEPLFEMKPLKEDPKKTS
jgi:hypothetical protein